MQSGPETALVDALQLITRDLVTLALESVNAGGALGLTPMRLLFAVNDRPGGSCIELAGVLGTSASSITRQADRLVRSGHLLREPNPANRSMVMLRLTAQGRQAVDDVLAWRASVFERVGRAADLSDHEGLARSLSALHAALADEIAAGFGEK